MDVFLNFNFPLSFFRLMFSISDIPSFGRTPETIQSHPVIQSPMSIKHLNLPWPPHHLTFLHVRFNPDGNWKWQGEAEEKAKKPKGKGKARAKSHQVPWLMTLILRTTNMSTRHHCLSQLILRLHQVLLRVLIVPMKALLVKNDHWQASQHLDHSLSRNQNKVDLLVWPSLTQPTHCLG